MPFVRFKGFEKSVIERISPDIVEQFSVIAEIPGEIVKIELLQVEPIVNSPLSVEIFMFQREQEKHDAIASMIHQKLSQNGYKNPHIFFVILSPALYYKEGRPIKEIPRKPVSSQPGS